MSSRCQIVGNTPTSAPGISCSNPWPSPSPIPPPRRDRTCSFKASAIPRPARSSPPTNGLSRMPTRPLAAGRRGGFIPSNAERRAQVTALFSKRPSTNSSSTTAGGRTASIKRETMSSKVDSSASTTSASSTAATRFPTDPASPRATARLGWRPSRLTCSTSPSNSLTRSLSSRT